MMKERLTTIRAVRHSSTSVLSSLCANPRATRLPLLLLASSTRLNNSQYNHWTSGAMAGKALLRVFRALGRRFKILPSTSTKNKVFIILKKSRECSRLPASIKQIQVRQLPIDRKKKKNDNSQYMSIHIHYSLTLVNSDNQRPNPILQIRRTIH